MATLCCIKEIQSLFKYQPGNCSSNLDYLSSFQITKMYSVGKDFDRVNVNGFEYVFYTVIRDGSYWISKENSLEGIELSSINKVSLVYVSSCNSTGSIRDDRYWTSRENSLELIELSSINKVSLVYVSSCSNTGSIRDEPH